MIKITDIQDPIAEDVWTLKRSDGQIVSHRIIVGRPQPETEGDGHSDWYCPIMIEGFLPRVVPAMGVGPVDSLMNAMHLVKTFFDKNKDHFEEIGNNANKVVERNVANASSLTTDVSHKGNDFWIRLQPLFLPYWRCHFLRHILYGSLPFAHLSQNTIDPV
jgi:hypothetical protein